MAAVNLSPSSQAAGPTALGADAISVVVPVRNGALYLREAIESALSQGLPPLEVIVVDDHSSDNSISLTEEVGGAVRVLRSSGTGAAAARNVGVQAANGRLVAFLDSDDRLMPGALASLVAALSSAAGASIAFGRMREFRSPELPAETKARLLAREGDVLGFLAGSFIFRAPIFTQVGALDTSLRAGEVADWLSRLRHLGIAETSTDQVVLERRLHAGHLSAEKQLARADMLRVVRSNLARQRAQRPSR